MAAVATIPPPFRQSPTPPPSPGTSIAPVRANEQNPPPVPNKHLPTLAPGSPTPRTPETPPASPPSRQQTIQTSSLLHRTGFFDLVSSTPPVYAIGAPTLSDAVDHLAAQPLPPPRQVFPWLHGLHPENRVQCAFFAPGDGAARHDPKCFRGITIVKANGDLTHSRLKGSISPDELFDWSTDDDGDEDGDDSFVEFNPQRGFSVRNFHIQAGKMATVSDIVVYGDKETSEDDVLGLAKKISRAQKEWRDRNLSVDSDPHTFSTFVLVDRFPTIEETCPQLVTVDADGNGTGQVMDFFNQERLEMYSMTYPSEISQNVWLGPTPDETFDSALGTQDTRPHFDVYIEARDAASLPSRTSLRQACRNLLRTGDSQQLDFPASGSIQAPYWADKDVEKVFDTCQWIYDLAHSDSSGHSSDSSEDTSMTTDTPAGRKILIHCADGYTENSLLALIYLIYAEEVPAYEAWIRLHKDLHRNFFAYPSDVGAVMSVASRLGQEKHPLSRQDLLAEPDWSDLMDGSLPSRILPYMYLGNLNHANNASLLRALGITQVLSVGEPVSWPDAVSSPTSQTEGLERLFVDGVQDNGIDSLASEFPRCLEFIERGKLNGGATLVHCRVGVSRSATICIAEVMKTMKISFPRAYCFVRARRLNVIIQPHLRFVYELLKWEERQHIDRGEPLRREFGWASIAREIALMNRPYSHG